MSARSPRLTTQRWVCPSFVRARRRSGVGGAGYHHQHSLRLVRSPLRTLTASMAGSKSIRNWLQPNRSSIGACARRADGSKRMACPGRTRGRRFLGTNRPGLPRCTICPPAIVDGRADWTWVDFCPALGPVLEFKGGKPLTFHPCTDKRTVGWVSGRGRARGDVRKNSACWVPAADTNIRLRKTGWRPWDHVQLCKGKPVLPASDRSFSATVTPDLIKAASTRD